MPRSLRLLSLLLGLVALLGLASACGGSGGKNKPTTTAVVTTTAKATPTKGATGGATQTASPRTPSPFQSFHYKVDLTFTVSGASQGGNQDISGTVEGDYVAPNSHAFNSTFTLAGISGTEAAVIIGDQAWYKASGSDWRATTADDPDVLNAISLTSADPTFLNTGQLSQDLSALNSDAETVNGVATKRYHIPKETVAALTDLFGDSFIKNAAGLKDFEMTVWLENNTGALVKAQLNATATPEIFGANSPFTLPADATITVSIAIDVSQINDSGITIAPPI